MLAERHETVWLDQHAEFLMLLGRPRQYLLRRASDTAARQRP